MGNKVKHMDGHGMGHGRRGNQQQHNFYSKLKLYLPASVLRRTQLTSQLSIFISLDEFTLMRNLNLKVGVGGRKKNKIKNVFHKFFSRIICIYKK